MEPRSPPLERENSIRVIVPYWHAGTWVFDDPQLGLLREPFVSGVPEILDDLVAAIPNARQGFRLLFSGRRFPSAQARFIRADPEFEGYWYEAEDGRRGWLCPALLKYFSSAPEKLYVRAEPL